MMINNKDNNSTIKNQLFFISIICVTLLLFISLYCFGIYKGIFRNDKNRVILDDKYSKQIGAIEEKLKNIKNSEIVDKKITFKLTTSVVQPAWFSYDVNYTGIIPETITVKYTMSMEEALKFLDRRYRRLQEDKNWYISQGKIDEYNFDIAETVNVTKDICKELKKESPLFANEDSFE
jgi:hypothetical protein